MSFKNKFALVALSAALALYTIAGGWLATRFASIVGLGLDLLRHHDPSVAKIAIEAFKANPVRLPIRWWERPYFLRTGRLTARADPNDLRVLKRHGFGAFLVPMAINHEGQRAGTRERFSSRDRGTHPCSVRGR